MTSAPQHAISSSKASSSDRRVPSVRRLWLSILLGGLAGGVTLQKVLRIPYSTDFGQIWFASRAILKGANPYALIGAGLPYEWPWPCLYPLPAAIIAVPFAPFSRAVATVLFSFLAGAAFAWALMEHGYGPLFGFFGGALHYAAETAQWSPLLAAALVVPPLSFLLIAKPTIGAAIFAARPSWWAIGGAVILFLAAYIIQPGWMHEWMLAIQRNSGLWLPHRPYQIPALAPGGFLALLVLLRWRRPEARLVAALACIPQSPLLYETVPLFLIPRSFWQAATLLILSYAQPAALTLLMPHPPSQADYMDFGGRLIAWLLYLPASVMVLTRPNEGGLPTWIERRTHVLPRWIRGIPAAVSE
jgi:hypothetical protein